mmetsp:Transcript_6881/g.11115  ORF Transcript_6881/g.11115 Transcript_6881/m.11115 type:complete len:504 (+) Transcript_6881:73-1584(+)
MKLCVFLLVVFLICSFEFGVSFFSFGGKPKPSIPKTMNKKSSSNKDYDIIVWGATGYTGQLVAEYLARNYGTANPEFKWAIGGRSTEKLNALKETLSEIDPMAKNLPVVTGDSADAASMAALAARTEVVLTTVGPYQKYGNELVAACVEAGIKYCDLTGETYWIQDNVARHHARAAATGARIVHCCGFDSVPSEMGTLLLAEHMKRVHGGSLEEVANVLVDASGGVSGGTIASLLGQLDVLRGLSREEAARRSGSYMLNPEGDRPEGAAGWDTGDGGFGYNRELGAWTAPFVMAAINAKVVRRSNALLGNYYGAPFRYGEFTGTGSGASGLLSAAGATLATGLVGPLLYFPATRGLLQRYLPQPGEGPTKEARDNGYFVFNLVGKGKTEAGAPVTLRAEVGSREGDGGYKETAKMLAESALCLALADLPPRAGVLTPASAMGLELVKRLNKANMFFSVTEDSLAPESIISKSLGSGLLGKKPNGAEEEEKAPSSDLIRGGEKK